MRIQYLSQMAIAATLSMGLVVGCGANPCAAKPGATTTEKAAPCASKAKPCASKAAPCASKAKPCASKAAPCASKKP
jgi:hypothetical protein